MKMQSKREFSTKGKQCLYIHEEASSESTERHKRINTSQMRPTLSIFACFPGITVESPRNWARDSVIRVDGGICVICYRTQQTIITMCSP